MKDKLKDDGFPALYAIATKRRELKFTMKHQGCQDRGQIFLPLINTPSGAFVPQDPATLEVHTIEAKKVFGNDLAKQLGRVGTRPRSIEEGFIRRWSRKAVDTEKGGKGAFDATLSVCSAAGLVTMQTHRNIAYAALRFTARAVLCAFSVNNVSTTF